MPPSRHNGRAGESRLRVVLVDGHEVSRAACGALLRTEGVEVASDLAPDDRAVPTIRRLAPDIAIVDVRPGEEAGLDLVRRIRAIPVEVILTSSAPRSSFPANLDGFDFVAKADLCNRALKDHIDWRTHAYQDD